MTSSQDLPWSAAGAAQVGAKGDGSPENAATLAAAPLKAPH